MLRGVLALMLGVAAILYPLGALFAFTMTFAAYAFVDGLLSMRREARAGGGDAQAPAA